MGHPDEPTDEALLVAARTDPAAFEAFYRRRVALVVRFAARRSSTPSEVVDLVSAIWLEVVASIDRFDERRGTAVGWVLGIAAHLCASDARRRGAEAAAVGRLAALRVLDEDDHDRLVEELDASSAVKGVVAAIRALPEGERAVAELALVEGLSPAEAARALGIAAPAVRMRLARARRKLRAATDIEQRANQEVIT
jgi:RNA polymerase sigma factor (sigma-70 family)